MPELEYKHWARQIRELADCVAVLGPAARAMKLQPIEQRGWFGPLFHHLRTEVSEDEPAIRVAITSGTNTGKSTVFNQLVGAAISRTEKEATKTKHPVCVVPQGTASAARLAELFPDFTIRPWQSEHDAVAEGADDILILREDPSGRQSRRLILLDTPDVDGVLKENWRRAELVRNAADVLIVTLTMQKYNDNDIVQFFRSAAQGEKTFIVVFNFIDWPEDREICQKWLHSFEQKIGTQAHFAYAVPYDPQGAREFNLPFYPLTAQAVDLGRDLAELKFSEIKVRSLTGSLRQVLHEETGVSTFLREVRARAHQFMRARDTLVKEIKARNVAVPALPSHLAWRPFARWLETRKLTWAVRVHGWYRKAWEVVTRPLPFTQTPEEREAEFRRKEWQSYSDALHQILDSMDRWREQGNQIMKDALGPSLAGPERKQLFDDIRTAYEALPLANEDFDQYVMQKLDELRDRRPHLIRSIEYGIVGTAVARPVISISLFALPMSEVAAHASTQAALASAQEALAQASSEAAHQAASQALAQAGTQAAQHTATAVAADATVALAGEATAQGSSRLALMQFLAGIFAEYYRLRAIKLTAILEERIIGPAMHRLDELSAVAGSEELSRAAALCATLKEAITQVEQAEMQRTSSE